MRPALPEEPTDIRDRVRATLEGSPKKGAGLINDAAFIADYLWREWEEDFGDAGYDGFLAIVRGNADEARLWVVGERPWSHFADGLAGRVRRRMEAAGPTGFEPSENEHDNELATTGVCE